MSAAPMQGLDREIRVAGEAKAGRTVRLRLPATSANLGPGFDAIGLALTLALEVEATAADSFSVHATGRNVDICSSLTGNLLIETYLSTQAANGLARPVPLALRVDNGIPLGMGCGSSAAVRLAGVALASHFAGLGWDRGRILAEASLLERHPDNAAACWIGGLAVATIEDGRVHAATIKPAVEWRILLALPRLPLATSEARAILPSNCSREDAVANIQRAALLTAAFSLGRGDLLRVAMQDRLHQPFRGELCPLLPVLLPLAGQEGILGVALSGAGPAVLLIVESAAAVPQARARVMHLAAGCAGMELVECGIELEGAAVA